MFMTNNQVMAESYKYPDVKNYKFRELKVYSSTEWLADNKKKYRQVFDLSLIHISEPTRPY